MDAFILFVIILVIICGPVLLMALSRDEIADRKLRKKYLRERNKRK